MIVVPPLQAATLRKDLDALQQQLQEAQKLLRIADPEGYFTPGTFFKHIHVTMTM